MILAKPVIDKQYWILNEGDQKVGNIQAVDDGYQVTIKNKIANYKTIPMLSRWEKIEFVPSVQTTKPLNNQVHGYATGCKSFNGMWNVQLKLPLFTKTNKSKSWFAAGWYAVKQHRSWKVLHNPKLIVLERYAFKGPFHSKEEANDKSVS